MQMNKYLLIKCFIFMKFISYPCTFMNINELEKKKKKKKKKKKNMRNELCLQNNLYFGFWLSLRAENGVKGSL